MAKKPRTVTLKTHGEQTEACRAAVSLFSRRDGVDPRHFEPMLGKLNGYHLQALIKYTKEGFGLRVTDNRSKETRELDVYRLIVALHRADELGDTCRFSFTQARLKTHPRYREVLAHLERGIALDVRNHLAWFYTTHAGTSVLSDPQPEPALGAVLPAQLEAHSAPVTIVRGVEQPALFSRP